MASRTDVKISVIVPVYNVEKELPRCIESLLTQTYSNFELLLMLICCPAAGRWMWRLGKKLKQG